VASYTKHISVLTPCYNEEGNVANLVKAVSAVFDRLPQYTYEHVFIDNHSKDNTVAILRELAAHDPHVKVIINARNFGHIRSPFYGMLQCKGDAVISLVADFQDPPEMIADFLAKWEEGYNIVIGVKRKSRENPLMFAVRKFFYNLLASMSDSGEQPVKNFTGFGLYDQKFIEVLRTLEDPYPYFRGLITELGFDRYEMEYVQPRRAAGKTKNNFFTLYDIAMLGFTNHSKLPLRLSAFIGFFSAIVFTFLFIYTIIPCLFRSIISLQ
jgi:glycosyltransferase involved in cell wall biosynthesis